MARAIQGQVAIVTGASSGIGAATARELARRGAKVVLAARRAAELEALAAAIKAAGGEALVAPTDVGAPEEIARLVEQTVAAFGRVDILVNSAGIGWNRKVAETPAEDLARIVGIDLTGTMLATRAVLPGMLERRQGVIIVLSSIFGHIPLEPAYSATKFGVRGFALALRRQIKHSGVAVSVVSPGFVRTPLTVGVRIPMVGPERVARLIVRMAARPRREVVVPRIYRAAFVFDRLVPGLFDWLARALG
jgi:short-subunit dehydrogenase